MPRVLGPLVSSASIERAAQRLLVADRHLIGAYLDEVTRQEGTTDRVQRPRSVVVRERATRLVDEQLPALLLIAPGTIGDPTRDGDGNYAATWQMTVAAVVQTSGGDESLPRDLASVLCAAATGVLLHLLPQADDRVLSVRWAGEASDDFTASTGDMQRTRAIVGRGLHITVRDVICDLAGPTLEWDEPDPAPGDPAPDLGDLLTVATTDLTVTPVEETS